MSDIKSIPLFAAIKDAAAIRAAYSTEFSTALAFAKLEIMELQAGIRGLTSCPGIENVARLIAKAKGHE